MEKPRQVDAECIGCSLSKREDRQILTTLRIESVFFYATLLKNRIDKGRDST